MNKETKKPTDFKGIKTCYYTENGEAFGTLDINDIKERYDNRIAELEKAISESEKEKEPNEETISYLRSKVFECVRWRDSL